MRIAWMAAALALVAGAASAQSAFSPGGPTVTLSVTGTTARVQVQSSAGGNVRVYNTGTVAVFLSCGDVTVTATTGASMPIAPGTVEVIGCSQQYVAGISAGTAASVYLTPGFGL